MASPRKQIHKAVKFLFEKPDQIPPAILGQIQDLITECGGVGTSNIRKNLQNAFLVGYAMDETGAVVGSVTLKRPMEAYRKKIEAATGLDLSGYLERGYTSVKPEFRKRGIPDKLIKGLTVRSVGQRIYVTIRTDNLPALKLTYKNGMALAAKFINDHTGHELGVFVNC